MCQVANTAGAQELSCLGDVRRGLARCGRGVQRQHMSTPCSKSGFKSRRPHHLHRTAHCAPCFFRSVFCSMRVQRTCGGAAAFPMRHLAVNEAPKRLRAFKSLPGAPITGPCTLVQPCLASTAGVERYSDGPPHEDSPHDGRELERQSIGLLIRGVRVQAPGGQPFSSHRGASAGQLPVF